MDELGKCPLGPTLRRLVKLVWEGGERKGWGHPGGRENGKAFFPKKTSRGNRRGRQPVKRDVVEDVVSRKALGLAVKDACDEFVTSYIVIEYPRGQSNRGILHRV